MILEQSLQGLPDSTQKLEALLHAYGDSLFVIDRDGVVLDYKAGSVMQMMHSPGRFLRKKIYDVLPAESGIQFMNALRELRARNSAVTIEYSLPGALGEIWYEARLIPQTSPQVIVIVRDITRFKRSEEKIKTQLEQLAALRSIDLAITSGMDLKLTLSVVIEHVRSQLKIDAAAVLLLNEQNEIEFAAGQGFLTTALQHTRLRPGEGYAGLAILQNRFVHVADLRDRRTDLLRSPFFSMENFVSYYAVPLVAKGQALGVLEIFHRASLKSDPDWINFMNTLAGQAAIAIENAMLFKNLQVSNNELTQAYERTIEGWARALHLRDRETEEHTRRVAELTVQLARLVGLGEDELVHIRRGAVLHDIGKVAIPDSILLKPGPLDEEEWKLMRRHPTIAVELLRPIAYLEPALDIPGAHHEKWDGSGYPQGLAGGNIPIAARVFALADVYDALTSDRPYRSAWTETEAVDYIRDQDGKSFDPHLTPAFLEMVGNHREIAV